MAGIPSARPKKCVKPTDKYLPPLNTNTFCLPQDHELLRLYETYKTSEATRRLESEANRTVYSSAFIENPLLGTLADMCVRVLAKECGPKEHIPLIMDDPLKKRIYLDNMSVDAPLMECYHIEDQQYWRRVVLAMHADKSLYCKKLHELDWRDLGISLKFVEIIEQMPAEYWEEQKMAQIIMKIRSYVKELHISHLQTQSEQTFKALMDAMSSEESTDTDSSSTEIQLVPNSVEQETEVDVDNNDTSSNEADAAEIQQEVELTERKSSALARDSRFSKENSKKITFSMFAMQTANTVRRRKKRKQHERLNMKNTEEVPEYVAPKEDEELDPLTVFDMPLKPDSEDDWELNVVDRRNPEKYLSRVLNYKYPPEDCHHINLTFLKDFIYLTTLTIEFLGPKPLDTFHKKHFEFSHWDMLNISKGIVHLKNLRIFRLINSKADAKKMEIILRALRELPALEILDFQNDRLEDDFGEAILEFFSINETLKELELGTNALHKAVLAKLGKGLAQFQGHLQYLGLSGAKLLHVGLHPLVEAMIEFNQVERLNLRGACASDRAIICCIARGLLRTHKTLVDLDITGMEFEKDIVATELVNAYNTNTRVFVHCNSCKMPQDIARDMNTLLERSQYVVENPYAGDFTKSAKEVEEYVKRVKNKTLLAATANLEKHLSCLKQLEPHQPTESIPAQEETRRTLNSIVFPENFSPEERYALRSHRKVAVDKPAKAKEAIRRESDATTPFEYNCNFKTTAEFAKNLLLPGTGNRFMYLYNKTHKFCSF